MKKLFGLLVLSFLGIVFLIPQSKAQELNLSEMDLNNSIHLYRDGELTGTYTGLSQAIAEAESGDVVKLIDNIQVSEASILSGKSLTINGDNHTITRIADITTITVNEGSSLHLKDITITDNAVNFAPNRYNSLINAKSNIPLCLGGVNETRNEIGDVTASVCATESLDIAKTHPQIYSVGDISGDGLTISNSLNSKGSAAIIVEKGGIEMINSSFIHNGASGTSNSGRGGAIRIGPNTATNIEDESPITKISFSECLFENNYARTHGGALSLQYTPEVMTIDNCTFSGNTAYSNGGAIHIPSINHNPTGYLPKISTGSSMPIGTLYINNSDFYSNWCGNDGAVIEDDDVFLNIDSSNFEHNYGTQPFNTSVGVVSSQAGGGGERGRIRYELKITNSDFKDTNTYVLGDHNMYGYFKVDNCSFEKQLMVLLSYNGKGEIRNSTLKNSGIDINCGKKGYLKYDISIALHSDYLSRAGRLGESTLILENNRYSNDCSNEYFPVEDQTNQTTGMANIVIENEENTRVVIHRRYYDNANVEGTDEIYYGATVDDGNYSYIKKDKFYDFDEFNSMVMKWSTGYQLESGKAMLFYLDTGLTELWSGYIYTTTLLYGKETDIHNITYEGMDGASFEGITHTYKFINLNHTQYLTELTPYTLNTPSRNGYKFEGRFLDRGYSTKVTSIETGSTGDITLYAKWEKTGTSGGGGGNSYKPDTPEEDKNPTETPTQPSQNGDDDTVNNSPDSNENGAQNGDTSPASNGDTNLVENEGTQTYSPEFRQAYEFAKQNGITTMPTIQQAKIDWKLTRIQMAKMLSQYAINVLGQSPDISKGIINFNDVTIKMNKDYDDGVTLAYQLGIMGQNMPNNNFRPNDEVTRAEFVTAFSRMLYNTIDGEFESTSKYYTHHMEKLEKEGIVTNTDPNMKELRGYVMIMLMRSVKG